MSGLISNAQESDGDEQDEQESETDGRDRERFSVYADRDVFDRVRTWATYLNVNQADILERAIEQYCDRLAEHHNEGDDPELPESDDEDPLL